MAPAEEINFDLHGDGKVSQEEIALKKEMLEIERAEEKAETQKKMSWVSLASMLIFTIVLFTPVLSDSRVNALSDLFGLFYIAQASIVGFYFGAQAYMRDRKSVV